MATLFIEDKKIVFTVILHSYLGDTDLKDYLAENLPDARCEFVIGSSGPSSSYDEYAVTIDAVQESVLLLTLKDFCKNNKLTHQIDIAD